MDVEQKRRVSWAAVIGGLFIAWTTGIFLSLGALGGTFYLLAERETLAIVLAVVAIALFYFAVYWFTRRHVRDLAMGILIGGCMVALGSGICGSMLAGIGDN